MVCVKYKQLKEAVVQVLLTEQLVMMVMHVQQVMYVKEVYV
jgi:hypothetical protein